MNPKFLRDLFDIERFHHEALPSVLSINQLLINNKTYTREMIESQLAASGLVRMFSVFEAAFENLFGKCPRGQGLITWLKSQNGVDPKGMYKDWETLEILYKLRHCFGHTLNSMLPNYESDIQNYRESKYEYPAKFKIVNNDEIELKISSLESLRIITAYLIEASPTVNWKKI
jgi:hypothetical protein